MHPSTEYRMNQKIHKWLELKAMHIKSKYLSIYEWIVRRGLSSVIHAKYDGVRREDGTVLKWNPEQIGPDEINIVLKEYQNDKYYIGRFNDFLQFYDNNILRRTIYTPKKRKKKKKTWYTIDTMDTIFALAEKESPRVEFMVHCFFLGIRPIGVFRMEMDGIDFQHQVFFVRDKGSDPDDKELGKPREIVWDPDTPRVVTRYLEWRNEQYATSDEWHGEEVPRAKKVLVYVKGFYHVREYKRENALYGQLKPLKEKLGLLGIDFQPYNIRRTAVDELFIMSIFEDENAIQNGDIVAHFDWESDSTIKKYRSSRALLLKKKMIKAKQIEFREKNREKLRRIGL